MSNPILNMTTGQKTNNTMMPTNNMNMLQQFMEFRNQMAGKNPQSMVEELIRSGKMTNQQYEQFKNTAQYFMK